MKNLHTSVLRLATIAASVLLSATFAHAVNPSYNKTFDVAFIFERAPSSGDDTTLYSATSTTLLSLYSQSAGTYASLGNLDSALNTTAGYGASWSSLTDLYFGAVGVRTNSGSDILVSGTSDPTRTVYFSLARGSNSNPGQAGSTASSQSTGQHTLLNSGIYTLANQFSVAGTSAALALEKSSGSPASVIDDQHPFSGQTLGSPYGVTLGGASLTAFSSAFTFGAAGNNVVAAVDLYRMKPDSTVVGEDGFADLTPQFLGNVVLKNTGEVGFVAAVPEPSTYALFALALGMGAIVAIRRHKTA